MGPVGDEKAQSLPLQTVVSKHFHQYRQVFRVAADSCLVGDNHDRVREIKSSTPKVLVDVLSKALL